MGLYQPYYFRHQDPTTAPDTAVEVWINTNPPCRWCGHVHVEPGICPHVKALEYHPDGTLKRVEFHKES